MVLAWGISFGLFLLKSVVNQKLFPIFRFCNLNFNGVPPDGHPNSPTCGHFKIPHPQKQIFRDEKEKNNVFQGVESIPCGLTYFKGGGISPDHRWGIFKWPSGEYHLFLFFQA